MEPSKKRQHIVKSLKAQFDQDRNWFESIADTLTNSFGSIGFLTINAFWFLIWILVNIGIIPAATFDPFPFGLLTMIVSLEAIFLSIFVLISQNRAAKVADLREEIDLQVNTIAEEEITKLMEMLARLLKKEGIDIKHDPEMSKMLEPIDTQKLEAKIEKEIS